MALNKKHDKSKQSTKSGAIISDKVGSYEKHPFFIKKANEAKSFLKKAGLPKELVKKA
ncbi:MAG: hypothetical protein JWM28_2210 [Chitinophagaceae bacterium]|nr:hypothetical protein [Chitinophagaceae bacterium]